MDTNLVDEIENWHKLVKKVKQFYTNTRVVEKSLIISTHITARMSIAEFPSGADLLVEIASSENCLLFFSCKISHTKIV